MSSAPQRIPAAHCLAPVRCVFVRSCHLLLNHILLLVLLVDAIKAQCTMGRTYTLWIALLLLLLLCPHTAALAPLVIGQTGPLTGEGGLYGQRMHAGIAVAIAEQNAAGGINGRNITLISLDDGYDPVPAQNNVRQLLDVHNVLLLAGVSGTPIAYALMPLILQHKLPYIGPLTGSPLTRTPFHEEFINVRASYPDEMVAMAAFLVEHLRVQRIACLYQKIPLELPGTTASPGH